MDVRIGLAESVRELTIEMARETPVDEVKATIESAISNGDPMVWLTDKRGRQFAITTARITYIELGSGANEPRIGFGAV